MSEEARRHWSPFSDLDPSRRAIDEATLMAWVHDVFMSGWPDATGALKPCWPMHADVVASLRGLRAQLGHCAGSGPTSYPQVKGGQMEAGGLWQIGWPFDFELDRARDRWISGFARCGGDAETCCRRREPEDRDGELLEPWESGDPPGATDPGKAW